MGELCGEVWVGGDCGHGAPLSWWGVVWWGRWVVVGVTGGIVNQREWGGQGVVRAVT